jgi:hypothetical protein
VLSCEPKPKRILSAAARRQIAAARRKRWAAFHAEHKSGNAKAAPKPKLSAAAKAKVARTGLRGERLSG